MALTTSVRYTPTVCVYHCVRVLVIVPRPQYEALVYNNKQQHKSHETDFSRHFRLHFQR